MDVKNLSQPMLDFSKASLDNSFAAFMMFQEQLDRWTQLFWGQMLSFPEETKKSLAEWNRTFRKNCDTFKKAMDEGFKTLESLVA